MPLGKNVSKNISELYADNKKKEKLAGLAESHAPKARLLPSR